MPAAGECCQGPPSYGRRGTARCQNNGRDSTLLLLVGAKISSLLLERDSTNPQLSVGRKRNVRSFSGHLHWIGGLLLAVLGQTHYPSREALTQYSVRRKDLCNAQRRTSGHTDQQDLAVILRQNIRDIIGYLLGRYQRLDIRCSRDLDLTLIAPN